jgi:hypothetical protein
VWDGAMLPSPQSFPGSSTGCAVCPKDGVWCSYCSGSVGLVSRFGQFYKSVDPGLVQVNICTEALQIVDVKIQIIPIGRQGVM